MIAGSLREHNHGTAGQRNFISGRSEVMVVSCTLLMVAALGAQAEVTYPPRLPDGKEVATDTATEFLKAPATLRQPVTVAQTAPTVDFLYYPGQTYPGKP